MERLRYAVLGCLLVFVAGGFAGPSWAQAGGDSSSWPMLRHDAQHTGSSSVIGPQEPTLRWRLLSPGLYFSPPAIAADGMMYLGNHDSRIYAVNPDGTFAWSFDTPASWVLATPCIGEDGTVFGLGGEGDGKLYALNPEDGSPKWSRYVNGFVASPVISSTGTIFAGNKEIYSVDASTGSVNWVRDFGGRSFSGTAYDPVLSPDETALYVPYLKPPLVSYLLSIDVATGDLNWEIQRPGGDLSHIAVGCGGMVYAASNPSEPAALTAYRADGSVAWEKDLGVTGMFGDGPAIGRSGRVYCTTSVPGKLFAIDPVDGSTIWVRDFGMNFGNRGIHSYLALDGAETIYLFPSVDRGWAITTAGEVMWELPLGEVLPQGDLAASMGPVLGPDGILYVARPDLVALGSPNTPPAGTILGPDSGICVADGSLVTLEGDAMDAEDGPLPEGSLSWISDLDGALGSGRIQSFIPSPGIHEITLAVVDGQGAVDETSIKLCVSVELDALEDSLANANATIDSQSAQILGLEADLGMANATIADRNAQIATLEGDLAGANAQIALLQIDLANGNARIATLEGDLASANEHIEILEGELASANEEIANTDSGLGAILDLLGLPFGLRTDPRDSGATFQNPRVNQALQILLDPAGMNYKNR